MLVRAIRARLIPSDGTVSVGAPAFVTGASTVIMGVLPLLIGFFAERLRLNWQQIGWLGAAGQAGTLTGTLLAYWLIERRLLRLGVQLGAACALVFSLLTAAADGYPTLLVSRALTSTGVGCVFAIGIYLLGRAAQPARTFSIMSGVQVACGSLHAALLPWIYAHFGYGVAVSSVAFWFATILVLTLRLPELASLADDGLQPVRTPRRKTSFSTVRLLGSVGAFQSSVVVIWIYSERMATAAGLSSGEIGTAIAIGSLGGIPASAFGALTGERFGYFPILLLATAALACGELLMFDAAHLTAYLTGQFIFNFGWMLGLSYYMGLLAKRDAGGRVIRLAPASLVIAGAVGPLCVALFTASNSAVPILGMSFALAGIALALALHRRS